MPHSIIDYILTGVTALTVAAVSWLFRKILMLDRETALVIQLMDEREKRRIADEQRRDEQRKELIDTVNEMRSEIRDIHTKQ